MKVPALIVSGFLGSGKTTLVGRLLDQARADGVRLAIVSNEFGDTGIDRALLDAGEDGFVELDGGCVCCRLSDALGETVANVVAKARPDRLVLETSGLALPGEVVLAFWREPIVSVIAKVQVVVVVDGERFLAAHDALMDEQIEAADLLVLNKCDLLSPSDQDLAEARLVEMTGRRVLRATRCDIDLAAVFPEQVAPRPVVDGDHEHDHAQFDSFVLDFVGVVDEGAVIARVAAEDSIRAKGFVLTPAGVRVVQGVGPRIELVEPRVAPPDALVGKVVVIRRA